MSDMIRAGAAFLASTLKKSASASVTMTRGTESRSVLAVVGKSTFESVDQNGVTESWESRDFIIHATDLPFGEPQRHDKITETIGNVLRVYQVSAPRGVPLFHYSDAFQSAVRIHTTRVD
jgi:hypothetical protein